MPSFIVTGWHQFIQENIERYSCDQKLYTSGDKYYFIHYYKMNSLKQPELFFKVKIQDGLNENNPGIFSFTLENKKRNSYVIKTPIIVMNKPEKGDITKAFKLGVEKNATTFFLKLVDQVDLTTGKSLFVGKKKFRNKLLGSFNFPLSERRVATV